jgi:hypothetical protein
MSRFDDEFDWHADQGCSALARLKEYLLSGHRITINGKDATSGVVDRLLEILRRSFLDPFAYRERDE